MRLFSSPVRTRCWRVARIALVVFVMLASFQLLARAQGKERPVEDPTFYRTTQIDGLSIFYREAGPKHAPTLLLLHGLPLFIADVRASLHPAFRSLSHSRARLPGLRP